MNWLQRNSKTIIKTAYILPILIAAGVSISHVIAWYGLTNPVSWAVYLSIGIEIAALSALAGITTKIGKGAYIPFIIVTFIQFIGNVFYAYQYIDITSAMFADWIDLVGDLFGRGDIKLHRRVLALIGGGFIPMISLSFLHLLVSFTNKEIEKEKIVDKTPILTANTKDESWEDEQERVREEVNEIVNEIYKEEVIKKWKAAGMLDSPIDPIPPTPVTIPDIEIEKEFILTEDEPDKSPEIDTLPKEVIIPEPIIEEPVIEEPVVEEQQKVALEDIKEIKEEQKKRNFSVPVPSRNVKNNIKRI